MAQSQSLQARALHDTVLTAMGVSRDLFILLHFHQSTHGLVAMTSAQHAEGRQFDPGWVYARIEQCSPQRLQLPKTVAACERPTKSTTLGTCKLHAACHAPCITSHEQDLI